MPDLPDLEISKLPTIDTVDKDNDYLVISKASDMYASGYGSFKVTPTQLELGGATFVDIKTVLEAGATTIVVQNAAITANSVVDVSTDPAIPYVTATSTVGEATITFDEQDSDVNVLISIRSIS
jgi:hypothetical protein